MAVEVYDVTEVNEVGERDKSEEVLKMINDLGLEGQKSLICNEGTEVCPYRRMTEDERFIYEVLCPVKQPVHQYDGGPIPLRVMQVIAHANSIELGKLEIWSSDGTVKDPVLVAHGAVYRQYFILARWGDELAPLLDLAEKAIKRFKSVRLSALKHIRGRVERDIAECEALDDSVVPQNASTGTPSYFAS